MWLTGAGLQHAWGSKTRKQSKQATWRMNVRAKHKRVSEEEDKPSETKERKYPGSAAIRETDT